jgi:magnesium-transporting ATPase (P-type)
VDKYLRNTTSENATKRTVLQKEAKVMPRKLDMILLLWGIVASVLCFIAFLVNGGPDVNLLFAYSILATVVVGALGSTIYIASKGGSPK